MTQYEVWIDVECGAESTREIVCTLFARREFVERPLRGESITFWSDSEALASFNIVTPVGTQTLHYVPTEIDDLAHHFRPDGQPHVSRVCLRCVPVQVASIADANKLVAFMRQQHGFEVDPYGVNKLGS